MSGNYPDGLNQAMFDEYWADKLDDEYESIDFDPFELRESMDDDDSEIPL